MAPTRAEVQRLCSGASQGNWSVAACCPQAHAVFLLVVSHKHFCKYLWPCQSCGCVRVMFVSHCHLLPFPPFCCCCFSKIFHSVSTLFTALPLAAFLHLYLLNPFCVKWASQANMLWWWGLTCYPAPVGYRPACFTALVRHQSLWLYLAL